MGIQETDACMDKEPDGLVVYSKCDSCEPNQEVVPDPHHHSESHESVNGNCKPNNTEEDTEVREYDVKECTNENSAGKVSEGSHIEKIPEEKSVDGSKSLKKEKLETYKPKGTNKSRLAVKHASQPCSGSNGTKHTVPQPFALATEKRASSNGNNQKKLSNGNCQISNQPPFVLRKPLQPNNKKHSDEEDSCSITSYSASAARTLKSRATVASAPVFRCSTRAERRREFYTKLEEKQQALEAEKTQSEARTKEEREAAIKQLRKSLMFKANPMPSFYHEGPPPKVELKKPPPTRAKSPKLGRRKSCSDAVNSNQGDKATVACDRTNPHSVVNSNRSNTLAAFTEEINKETICVFEKETENPEETNELVSPTTCNGEIGVGC